MTVVILCRAVILGKYLFCFLAGLDNILVIVFVDLINIDRCYIRQCVVDSDLAVVGILGVKV